MKIRFGEKNAGYSLFLIMAAAIFLRFFRLGRQSFWIDEVLTIGSYSSPPAGISYWRKILWDVHGPLYSFIMHFWSMAGSSEVWLRIPGATAGTLSVFFLYRWLKRTAPLRTALFGALFMSLSPFNLYYSQELRFYSFLTLFIILNLLALSRFLERPSLKRAALLGIAAGAACLSHFMALFLCGGIAVYLAVTGRLRGATLRYSSVAAAIAFVMIFPWIYRQIYFLTQIQVVDITSLSDSEKLRGDLTLSKWAYPYILYAFSAGFSFGPSLRELHEFLSVAQLLKSHLLPILTVSLLFGAISVSGLIRSRRSGFAPLFISVFLFSVAAVTAAAAFNIKVFNIRYLMSVFPLFISLLAFGIPDRRSLSVAAVGAVCVVMLMSDWNYHMNSAYARDDIRGCAESIMEMEEEGDLILMPGGDLILTHYYRGSNKVETFAPAYMDSGRLIGRLEERAAAHERIWYVRSRHWDTDPADMIFRELSRLGTEVFRRDFPGARLLLYEFDGPQKKTTPISQ